MLVPFAGTAGRLQDDWMPCASYPSGRVFTFRRAVPRLLVDRLCRHDIKISLQTRHRPTAHIRCRAMTNAFERLVTTVEERADLTAEQIKVQGTFRQKWEKANQTARCASQLGTVCG